MSAGDRGDVAGGHRFDCGSDLGGNRVSVKVGQDLQRPLLRFVSEFRMPVESSPLGILKTIVAFANTTGGTVAIGVEDDPRSVRGISDPLDAEERIANLVSDTIEPRVLPDIEIVPWRRTHLLAIEVHPSSARPHLIRRQGSDGGVYVRVGSTNRRADAQLVQEMQRYSRGQTFDEQPMPDLDSEAIDFRVASESFAPVRTLSPKDLRTLRLVTEYQGRDVPTVGGILLFGKDRDRHFPEA